MKALLVHNYNLFGESAELPDVVHCETIRERSQLHDWEFTPHRHARLHQVLLVARGGGTASLEGAAQTLAPGTVVNVPMGSVHGFSFEKGTDGWVVTLEGEVLDQMLHPNEGLRPVLSRLCTSQASDSFNTLMKNIFSEYHGRDFARAHQLRTLAAQLLGALARLLHAADPETHAASDQTLVRRFEALLNKTYLDHWSVADYAGELAVSPTHLSRVLRSATGQSAKKLIEARMLREARRQLVYTNLPINQIAYALGFFDPAYFSRVFTRGTGLSPRAFRARQETTG